MEPTSQTRFVPDYLLLKLASRCNINCDYCYWFRDASVYEKPALLTPAAQDALVRRLGEHVEQHSLSKFSILMHGGEPLLLGKERTASLLEQLRSLEHDLGFELALRITTNGMLLDAEWADILCRHEVGVTISIDGPPAIHDLARKDFKARGTHAAALEGLERMRQRGADPGVLAVCNPSTDPREMLRYFVEDLGVGVDILVPDATHEDKPPSIAPFYKGLFDVWYDEYAQRGVEVRFLSSLVKGVLGVPSRSESIGYGELTTMTMLTDGSLEALDILRTSRQAVTKSNLNILTDPIDAICDDPVWKEVRSASVDLPETCQQCPYKTACGGGHIASRWSNERRWDNPSVYCEDFKLILSHVWDRLCEDLTVEAPADGVLC